MAAVEMYPSKEESRAEARLRYVLWEEQSQ
jgi:hypothetical protein